MTKSFTTRSVLKSSCHISLVQSPCSKMAATGFPSSEEQSSSTLPVAKAERLKCLTIVVCCVCTFITVGQEEEHFLDKMEPDSQCGPASASKDKFTVSAHVPLRRRSCAMRSSLPPQGWH
ncbi:hypothetical protein BC826DRAFT_1097271 [Russula brevipes]|nr:hypothetical protein BC826DRAFT_1097271 [Russula brevipes]